MPPSDDFEVSDALAEVLRRHGTGILNEPTKLRSELEVRLGDSSAVFRRELTSLTAAARDGVAGELQLPILDENERSPMVNRVAADLGITYDMAGWLVDTLDRAMGGSVRNAAPVEPPLPIGPFAPASPAVAPHLSPAGRDNGSPGWSSRQRAAGVGLAAAAVILVVGIVVAVSSNGGDSASGAVDDVSVGTESTASQDVTATTVAPNLAPNATVPDTTMAPTTPPPTTVPPTTLAPTTPPPTTLSPENVEMAAIVPGACVQRVVGATGTTGLRTVDCASPEAYGTVLAGGSQVGTTTECPAETDTTLSFKDDQSDFKFCLDRLIQGYAIDEFFRPASDCTVGAGEYGAATEFASTLCIIGDIAQMYVKHSLPEADYAAALVASGVPIERIGTWSAAGVECGVVYAVASGENTTVVFTFHRAPFAVRGVGPAGTSIEAVDEGMDFTYIKAGC